MEWSHDLLGPSEQVTLRRLAVFHGGFTLAAAESVCSGGEVVGAEVLDHLTRLLDASLLVHETGADGRYGMLESVRQYAMLLLGASGEEPVIRRRHADHYCGLLPGDPGFDSPEFRRMLEHLAGEADNFIGGLGWAVDARDGDRALRLAAGLMRHWFFTGQAEQSLYWLPRVLQVAGEAPTVERARAVHFLGVHLTGAGRRQEARTVLEEAAAMAEQLDDPDVAAGVVFARSRLAEADGDLRASRDLLLEHVATTRRLGIPDLPLHLGVIGGQSVMLGDFELASSITDDLEAVGVAHGQPMVLAWATGNRALLAYYQGDLVQAEERFQDAVDALTRLGREEMAEEVNGLAQVSLARGELDAAEHWAHRLVEQGRQNLVTSELVRRL
jgi:non-specific serine/threonine protein kinase